MIINLYWKWVYKFSIKLLQYKQLKPNSPIQFIPPNPISIDNYLLPISYPSNQLKQTPQLYFQINPTLYFIQLLFQLSYNIKMKRISHFTVNDIMTKRNLQSQSNKRYNMNRTKQNKSKMNSNNNNNKDDGNNFNEQENQLNQNQVLTKIIEQANNSSNSLLNTSTKSISYCNFNQQTKAQLIQIISKKLNMSLNVNKLLPKIKIKKIDNIQIIQKNGTPIHLIKNNIHSMTTSTNMSGKKSINSCQKDTKKFSYFLITGSVHKYQQPINPQQKRKRSSQYFQQQSNQIMFYNWKQFQTQYPQYKRNKTYGQFMGFGQVFEYKANNNQPNIMDLVNNSSNSKQLHQLYQKDISLNRSNTERKVPSFLIAQNSIFVQVQNPQYEDQYINQTGMEYQKMTQLIQSFKIFNALGKKIRNYAQYFQYKQYRRNQQIYSIGDMVNKFYLIIKGQIVFQHHKTNPIKSHSSNSNTMNITQSRKNSVNIHFTIKTESLSSGNYFGQEQIIHGSQTRLLSAKCKSSKCQMLQISRQKFQKMLQYSDFYQIIKKSAQMRLKERLTKLQKNQQIREKFACLTQFNDDQKLQQSKSQDITLINAGTTTQRQSMQPKTLTTFTPKNNKNNNKFKIMHGNIIRKYSKQQNSKLTQDIQFSMLKVNPDMYQKTMDKFRKYSIKPPQKYVPQVNWQLKRVWKVLNLQNVLRQQAQINNSQGRKYYDSHKRYMYHINQSKSLRPKTSSSTYRTKLQYIAYLQQFRDVSLSMNSTGKH